MQLHELKPSHKSKKKKRIGRGGKRGSYSGKGIKGQKSRAGRRMKPIIRDIIKRYHKLRGYRFKSKAKSQDIKLVILNLETLEKKFQAGEKVSPESLLNKELIHKIRKRTPKVKILGKGNIKKTLFIEGCSVSKSAKEKIEKAGGKVIKHKVY